MEQLQYQLFHFVFHEKFTLFQRTFEVARETHRPIGQRWRRPTIRIARLDYAAHPRRKVDEDTSPTRESKQSRNSTADPPQRGQGVVQNALAGNTRYIFVKTTDDFFE